MLCDVIRLSSIDYWIRGNLPIQKALIKVKIFGEKKYFLPNYVNFLKQLALLGISVNEHSELCELFDAMQYRCFGSNYFQAALY